MTQEGGYSPGAAVRVRVAKGGRAFVKALSVDVHAPSAALYRNEAAAMPHLPPDLPVPRLLHVHDDGKWVALVFEDVEGRHPAIPWRQDQFDRVTAVCWLPSTRGLRIPRKWATHSGVMGHPRRRPRSGRREAYLVLLVNTSFWVLPT